MPFPSHHHARLSNFVQCSLHKLKVAVTERMTLGMKPNEFHDNVAQFLITFPIPITISRIGKSLLSQESLNRESITAITVAWPGRFRSLRPLRYALLRSYRRIEVGTHVSLLSGLSNTGLTLSTNGL